MIIRDEAPIDAERIAAVTIAAFRGKPYSRQTEHFILRDLRAAGALAVSLVAEVEGVVVGHAAFSPVGISDGSAGWYGLGPVSVLPEHQRQGIGRALITEGLSRLKALGGRGCVLVGDPGYYTRLGFRSPPSLALDGVPPAFFLALPFGDQIPQGRATFHPAFGATL
jgi:putative acetyltransferase